MGANPKGGGFNLLFGQIFPENWTKMKEIELTRLIRQCFERTL